MFPTQFMARGITRHRIRERFLRAHFERSRGKIDDFCLFVVTPSGKIASHVAASLDVMTIEPRFAASIGFLGSGEEYQEIARIDVSGCKLFGPPDPQPAYVQYNEMEAQSSNFGEPSELGETQE